MDTVHASARYAAATSRGGWHTDTKRRILAEIDRRQDELVDLCSRVIQHPAENPPGDTSAAATFLEDLLRAKGLRVRRYESRPGNVSIVAQLPKAAERPHFMFNAHLDHFPPDIASRWTHPPYSGHVEGGKIYGRGVADMRAGLTASLFSLLLIHELELPLPGMVSLMAVADEESGGWWGTGYLTREHPELIPDACVIGEPDGTEGVRVGEKGKAQMRLRLEGEPYYAAMAIGEDCIQEMGAALQVVRTITDLRGSFPDDIAPYMDAAMRYSRVAVDRGRGWLLKAPSVNFGVIRGGLKVNMVPRVCEVEVDIRVPLGLTPEEVKRTVEERLAAAGHGRVQVEFMPPLFNASYTSPDDRLVQLARANVIELTGKEPTYSYAFAATDARYFRPKGVPCVIYGPRPHGVAGFDEYVTVEELLTVTRVHAATAVDWLSSTAG